MTDDNIPKIEYAHETTRNPIGENLLHMQIVGAVKFTTYADGLKWIYSTETKAVLFRKPLSTVNIIDDYCEKLIAERFGLEIAKTNHA